MKTLSVIALMLFLPLVCYGEVNLEAWVQSQSPDGRLVEVNGAIWSTDACITGWVYDWGDGTSNTGWFPMLHRYGWSGEFIVRVTGYDDSGDIETVEFQVIVPEPNPTDVVFVLAEPGCASMKCGDSLEIKIFAFDRDWNRLSMQGRTLEFYYPGSQEFVEVEVQDTTLLVIAKHLEGRDFAWASIYACVDGAPIYDFINIITNKHPGDFTHHHVQYVASYLPDTFFTSCDLSIEEYTHINDLAFYSDYMIVREKNPNLGDRALFQGISYSPPLFGSSGNPIGLGDYSIPQNGRPYFDVIFHEMGHNFASANQLFNCLGIPGPFYHETVAEWFVQFDLNKIINDHSGELSPLAIEMLESIRDENRNYHLLEYQNYINGGCQFDYYDIMTSHALVQKIYEYCDVSGWDVIGNFIDLFDHSRLEELSAILASHGGIADESHRVTFFIAALSKAFGRDLRSDFYALNFPIDDPLFEDLFCYFNAGVRQDHPGQEIDTICLYQNHPNPCFSSTVIRYRLTEGSTVSLNLYNIGGRLVKRIDQGYQSAGINSHTIDVSNLSPGIYLYEIIVGAKREARKLVVVR